MWPVPAVFVAALAVYLATLAPGLSFAHHGADGGDLVTAAYTLGVPHPTGYPTYTLLAWLFTHVPIGSIGYRANLLSAVAAALAAGLVADTARRVLVGSHGREVLSAAAGLGLAFAPLLWGQAVIAEVYTLLVLCAALLVWLLVRWRQGAGNWALSIAALVFGLGLGNHLALLFFTPALVGPAWPGPRRQLKVGTLVSAGALLLVGLSVYVYLPLAAAGRPPVSWGDARGWDGLWWLISGRLYRPYVFGLPPGQVADRLAAWTGMLGAQLGGWGLALALVGAGQAWQRDRAWRAAALGGLLWAVLAVPFAFGYSTDDAHLLLLPLLVPLTLAWALGADGLLRLAAQRGTAWRRAALTVAALLPILSLTLNWRATDLRGDRSAEAYGRQVLAAAAPGAVIVTQADAPTFALWYARHAEGRRPDVAVVNAPLLDYGWYRAQLGRNYPGLVVPEPAAGDSRAEAEPAIRALIAANVEQRPVYATDPSDEWRAWFEIEVPQGGVLARVTARSR